MVGVARVAWHRRKVWGSMAHAVEVYGGRRLLGMCWFGGGKQGDASVWFAWVLLRGVTRLVRLALRWKCGRLLQE